MAFFNAKAVETQTERRVARRQVVDCPARFDMAGGGRDGRLVDLSEHGARFDTTVPPVQGSTGFLRWNGEDHYCTVIWTAGSCCGLQFERPIAAEVVDATCSHVEVALKPVAAVGRIQMGQRRGRLATEE